MVRPEHILAFLGRPGDDTLAGSAEQAIPVVTTMVRAYTRGNGFWEGNDPLEDVEAVIVSATARLISNPSQLAHDETAGPFARSLRGAFTGWTLAELAILNRYRTRAQ